MIDQLLHVFSMKMARRDIHGDPHWRETLSAPGLDLCAGGMQHPLANGNDQTGLFSQGNEFQGRDKPIRLWAPPAYEGLHDIDSSTGEFDLRLIMQYKFIAH